MNFSTIIGLESAHIDPDKHTLTTVYVRDCMSEYSPANGTVGIMVTPMKDTKSEKTTAPLPPKNPGEAIAHAIEAAPIPVAAGPSKKLKKMGPRSSNDFVLFPFANLRYCHDFLCRKTRRMSDIHQSEILVTDNKFVLHEAAKIVTVDRLDSIEFDLVLPDVYKYGAVSVQTTSDDNVMKALTTTLRNASTFFKYNCVLKLSSNTDYMNPKYGPATCAVSIIQPSQFLPIYGKEDGCIIHINLFNKKGHCFDFVGLAANEEESLFAVDGETIYSQGYKKSFTSTAIPGIKKYGKYITNSFGPGKSASVAKASGK